MFMCVSKEAMKCTFMEESINQMLDNKAQI